MFAQRRTSFHSDFPAYLKADGRSNVYLSTLLDKLYGLFHEHGVKSSCSSEHVYASAGAFGSVGYDVLVDLNATPHSVHDPHWPPLAWKSTECAYKYWNTSSVCPHPVKHHLL